MTRTPRAALAALSLAAALAADGGTAQAFPHVVKQGETLAQIAERTYGRVEMEQLLRPALTGERTEFEWVGRRTGIVLAVQAVPVRDDRAGVIGVMAVCRDVTPRHEVDAALRSSRGRPTGAPARAR